MFQDHISCLHTTYPVSTPHILSPHHISCLHTTHTDSIAIHPGPDPQKSRIFDFFQNRPSITGINSQTIDSLFSRLNDLKKYRFFKNWKIGFLISKNTQNSHINHTGRMDILKNGIFEKSQKSQKRPLSGNPAFWLLGNPFPYLFLLGLLGATRLQGRFGGFRNFSSGRRRRNQGALEGGAPPM